MCRGAATKSNWGAISECCPPGRAHVLLEAALTFLVNAGNGKSPGPAASETARCLTPVLSGLRSPGKQGSCPHLSDQRVEARCGRRAVVSGARVTPGLAKAPSRGPLLSSVSLLLSQHFSAGPNCLLIVFSVCCFSN